MKLTLKNAGHPRMCLLLTRTAKAEAKALFSDATNLSISHVATAVEVSQGSYVARSSELVERVRKQAHVVIEIYYYRALNWKIAFVKILLVKIPDCFIRQNFAPSNICAIRYSFQYALPKIL